VFRTAKVNVGGEPYWKLPGGGFHIWNAPKYIVITSGVAANQSSVVMKKPRRRAGLLLGAMWSPLGREATLEWVAFSLVDFSCLKGSLNGQYQTLAIAIFMPQQRLNFRRMIHLPD
jgi:hypothetical protein